MSPRKGDGQCEKYQPRSLSFIGRQYDRDQGGVDHIDNQDYRDVLVESLYLRDVNPVRGASSFHVASL
jgi:hypothetical protein